MTEPESQSPPPPAPTPTSEVADCEAGARDSRVSGGRNAKLLVSLVVLFLTAVGTWSAYWAELRNDQYQLVELGRRVFDGGRMYVDVWENKPPGIAWINALGIALSGGGQIGAWVLPGVAGLLAVFVFGVTMSRLLSGAAALATSVVAALALSIRLYDATSINPDFYSALADLVACSLWMAAVHADRRAYTVSFGLTAGLFWALAVTIRQTGIVGLMVVTVVALLLAVVRMSGFRRWLTTCLSVWSGFSVGIAAVGGVLLWRGTLGEAWAAVFEFNRGLMGIERVLGIWHAWPRVWAGLGAMQLPVWLGALGLLATWWVGKSHRPSPASVTAMALWWCVQVAAALLGPSGSLRYWLATFPPMLWLAGVGVRQIELSFRRLGEGHRSVFVWVCLSAAVLMGRPLFDHYVAGVATSFESYAKEETAREAYARLGEKIRELVPEMEAIYVWAYDVGLYTYSDRPSACRFTYPRAAEQMTEILGALESDKARLILLPTSGRAEFRRWCKEPCQDALEVLLGRYDRKGVVGRYDAWVRRD